MTLRIDKRLLAELKARARRAGRSTSAEVVQIVRREIVVPRAKGGPRLRSEGMFAAFETLSNAEIRASKTSIRGQFAASLARTRKTLEIVRP